MVSIEIENIDRKYVACTEKVKILMAYLLYEIFNNTYVIAFNNYTKYGNINYHNTY